MKLASVRNFFLKLKPPPRSTLEGRLIFGVALLLTIGLGIETLVQMGILFGSLKTNSHHSRQNMEVVLAALKEFSQNQLGLQREHALGGIEQKGERLVNVIAATAGPDLKKHKPDILDRLCSEAVADLDIAFCSFSDLSGSILNEFVDTEDEELRHLIDGAVPESPTEIAALLENNPKSKKYEVPVFSDGEKVGMARIYVTLMNVEKIVASRSVPIENFLNAQLKKGEIARQENQSLTRNAFMIGLALSLVLLIITLMISLWIASRQARAVAIPIQDAVKAIEALSHGDMTVQLQAIGTDETRKLSQGWNSSIIHLADLIREMRREVQSLASASDNLSGVSRSMHSASEQVIGKTDSIGITIKAVSDSLTTLASAIIEMEGSIREIARSAQGGVSVAEKATEKTAEADQMIKRLLTSTAKVQDVVSLIESISGQVQMLSLNAAIEAHRAGEAGKGFAVVAQEVKTLATQTRTAAVGIREQANTIAKDADQTSQVMSQMRDDIRNLHEMQSVIAAAVEEQSATTSEIGRNVQDVAGNSKTIQISLDELRCSAHSATEQANATHKASGELETLALDLGKAVSGFKTST